MIFEVLVSSLNICSKIPSNAIHNNGIDPTDQDMRGLEGKGNPLKHSWPPIDPYFKPEKGPCTIF